MEILKCQAFLLITCIAPMLPMATATCSNYLAKLQDMPWDLQSCPCTEADAECDEDLKISNLGISRYHPGASNCYRSKTPSEHSNSGQQCCYDSDGAILVGPPGGGTADRYSPTNILDLVNIAKHREYDVVPWEACCEQSNECDTYYQYRPSDDCSEYDKTPCS